MHEAVTRRGGDSAVGAAECAASSARPKGAERSSAWPGLAQHVPAEVVAPPALPKLDMQGFECEAPARCENVPPRFA